MTDHRLTALSPLDGRYADKCADLAALFSEAALIGYRLRVEAALVRPACIVGSFPRARLAAFKPGIEGLTLSRKGLDESGVRRVKEIERETNHDVKAVEYFLREQLAAAGATPAQLEFVHFACTSEDINNLSYAMMLADARSKVLLPLLGEVADRFAELAGSHAAVGDAFANARPAGNADDARQGGGEFRHAPAPGGDCACARRTPRQVQRRGRQLQCACRGRAASRLAGGIAPIDPGTRPSAERVLDADRTA